MQGVASEEALVQASIAESSNPISELDLPPDLCDIAYREFQETSELREQKLDELRSMIAQLPEEQRIADLSDKNLIRFIRGRKYNMEKALETTIKSRKFSMKHPELVENYSPEDFFPFGNAFQILSHRDKEGRVIGFIRPSVVVKVLDVMKSPVALPRLMCWIFKKLSEDPYVQVCGLVMLNSFSNLTYRETATLATTCSMEHRTAAIKYLQDCTAIRIKGIYVFDQPSFVAVIYNVLYYALSVKLRERLHICTRNFAVLGEEVHPDRSIFPRCVGGERDDDDGGNWIAAKCADDAASL